MMADGLMEKPERMGVSATVVLTLTKEPPPDTVIVTFLDTSVSEPVPAVIVKEPDVSPAGTVTKFGEMSKQQDADTLNDVGCGCGGVKVNVPVVCCPLRPTSGPEAETPVRVTCA